MYQLITKLKDHNIHLSAENDNLKIQFNGEKFPEDLLQEIKENKQALISYLSKQSSQSHAQIEVVAQRESYPLSSAQKRLWILHQVENGAVAYNMANQTILHGNYDVVKFEAAIKATIAHHEILRTVFRADEHGEGRQWILDAEAVDFSISYKDFTNLDAKTRQEKVAAYIDADATKPFDFENGPLLRVAMLQTAANEYVFYYNMHHIISDGWSMDVLAKNVMMAYEAIASGREVVLPALRIQYKDYASWQLQQLEATAAQGHKKYWMEQLTGELPVVDFPTTKKRPTVQTTNGRSMSTYIDKETLQALKQYVQSNNGSLFVGLLAIFNTLFYRYTGQEDCIVGTPVAGRDHADLEDQIGFYVNTLALRNQVNAQQTFEDVFATVKNNTFEAYSHQNYPFNQLIQDLQLKRNVSRNVVFDVMLTLHNLENSAVNFQVNEADVETIKDQGVIPSKYDMELNFKEIEGYLYFDIIFNTDVYASEMIENVVKHFTVLLKSALKNPTKRINELEILPKEEQQTLRAFNETEVTYNTATTVVELFAKQVADNPNKTALIYEGETLTFQQLDEKSNQVANYICSQNLSNTLIPICVDRSFEMLIGIWGILKSGNAYVPVDPTYPQERIDYILEDTKATQVFCTSEYTKYFENVMVIDLDTFNYEAQATTAPKVTISADQLAYCIYTSGTTGKPKGVLNAHAGLVNRLFWMRDDLNITADSVLFHKTPYVFDVSVWELTMPFITGCTLVIARPEGHLDPEYLQNTIANEKVTFIHFVPSMLNVFMDAVSAEKLQSLSHIVCSGEALSSAVAEKTKQALPTTQLYNLYGPTEAAIDVTAIDLTAIDTEKEGVSIGKPVANTKLYVVNTAMELQPVGVVGELLIGGIQVAKGYVNKPELTAEKFIKNPFGAGNLYKTGDLVRWLPNGTLDFLGRKDDQVKVNGYRIELGEVTNALEQVEGIKQAVAVVDESLGNKRLFGYVVSDNTSVEKETIKKQLKGVLPAYMIPTDFMQLDRIPLTINGKVDRKALPKPTTTVETAAYVAPRNEKETIIATIWQEVLGVEKVSVFDNFFALGGDSIIAIQFISKAKKQGITLKVKDVFEFQTVDELAAKVEDKIQVISEQGALEGSFDLLPIQNYFFEKGYTKEDHYNQSLLLTLPKNITTEQLNKAVAAVYQKHDILRTRFEFAEEKFVGVYESEIPAVAEETIAESDDVATTVASICASYQEGFNIAEGIVSKFVRINTPENEATDRLFIVAHHLVIDGVSWRIVAEDLQNNLQKITNGEAITIAEKGTSFRQWQERLANYANSETLNEEFAYWKSITEKVTTLPQDTDFDGKTSYKEVASYDVNFSEELTNSLLKESNQAFSTEINDLLLAALATSFSQWTSNNNLVIGLEGHGREELFNDVDITETVGWFTSLYPVLLENFDNDIEATIVQAKENLKAIPNKGIGYGALRYLANDSEKRVSLEESIDQVIFNYLGQAGQGSSETASLFNFTNEGKGKDIHPDNEFSSKIAINAVVSGGTLNVRWDYDSNRYAKATVATLAENYKNALETIVKFCKAQTTTVATPADYGLNGLVSHGELRSLKATMNAEEIEDIYQLSPLQEGMLFYTLFNNEPNAYVHQISFDLTGAFNLEYFKKAWEQIQQKHSVLRTSFHLEGLSVPVQCVHKNVALPLTYLDFTIGEINNIEEAVAAFIHKDANTAFTMDKAPLFRLSLLKQAESTIKFIFTTHHIISDGWSSPVIFGKYLENYQKLAQGEQLETLEATDNYKDYIAFINTKNDEEVTRYWKTQLKALSTPSLLPFTNTSKKLNTTFGNTSMVLRKETDYVVGLEQFAKKNRLTINTVIQGIWAYLLSQYTNSETVVFGTVISGRPTEIQEVEKRIGLYINTIPLCTSVDATREVTHWLNDIQSNYAVSREEYGHSSLVDIQKQSSVGRELFDSLLVFENYPLTAIEKTESDVTIGNLQTKQQNNYVLTISIAHVSETGLNVEFEYNSEVLSNATIEMIKGHFDTLLQTIVQSETIGDLEYLSKAESNALLQTVENSVSITNIPFVLETFKQQVAKTPENVAISFRDENITYAELEAKSNQLANCLAQEHNIQQGDVVGIKLDRSNWVLVSILAILKTGAAYVPIDPAYGSAREEHILNDANLSLLITESNYMFDMFDYEGNMLTVDIDFEATEFSETFETAEITADTLAYIIYTSGSTGKPKGVMIQHGALANYIDWASKQYVTENTLNNYDFGLYTSLSFDLTVTSIFLPILNGGTLRIYDQGDISQTLKSYFNSEISCIKLTPAHITLLKELNIEKSAVEVAVVGGDALLPHHVETLKNINPNMKIYNEYGPTEATVGCMIFEVTSQNEINIGKAIQNTEIYVLNQNDQLVANGVSGEICVGGAGLAKGYLNRPELTAEKFIPHPFKKGERLYKTGDVGSWLSDGNLAYLGRKDDQVKIRGYRIELGEIEQQLLKKSTIEEAVVLAHTLENCEKQLVAYLVFGDKEDTAITMRKFLSENVPAYMIPAHFVPVAKMPLTVNGKVDKDALMKLENVALEGGSEYVAPQNETEVQIAKIWEAHFGKEDISIREDYFQLGGDSIKMIRCISIINKEFDIEFPVATFYENPTIEGVAAYIADAASNLQSTSSETAKIKAEIEAEIAKIDANVRAAHTSPETIEHIYPISDVQLGMVLTSQIAREKGEFGVYHDQFLFQLGTVDVSVLTRAMELMVEKHETLRTSYHLYEYDHQVQIIHKNAPVKINFEDISAQEKEVKEAYIQNFLEDQRTNHPFDLTQAPTWRIHLFQIAPTDIIFVLQFHHVMIDGWGQNNFKVELFEIYDQVKNDASFKPAPLQCSMCDSIMSDLLEVRNEENATYWKEKMTGYKRLEVLSEKHLSRHLAKTYSDEFTEKLIEKCKQDNITPKALLLGAYLYALSLLSTETDTTIGLVAHRRPIKEDGDKLLGCFLNTIPFRFDIAKTEGASWLAYVSAIEDQLNELKGKDRFSLFEIADVVGESSQGNPFFDILFNFTNFHILEKLRENEDFQSHQSTRQIDDFVFDDYERTNTHFDLMVEQLPKNITLTLIQSRELKSKHDLEDMFVYLEGFLENYLNNDQAQINAADTFATEERNTLMEFAQGKEQIVDTSATIPSVFGKLVTETPNDIALVCKNTTLTYRQLDEVSNAFSQFLAEEYNVKRGEVIGIQLYRSEWMIVSIFGVLKAGAAYLPIDIAYPEDRVTFMQNDSNSTFTIKDTHIAEFIEKQGNYSTSKAASEREASDVAYIIYTSGSTGTPKGVAIKDHTLLNTILAQVEDFKLREKRNVLQFATFSFDASIWESFMSLLSGSTLFMIDEKLREDPKALEDYICENHIEVATFPPAYLALMDIQRLKGMKLMITAGEAPIYEDVKEFLALGNGKFVNAYGPTEISICASTHHVDTLETLLESPSIPIGKPIANATIYILDDLHQLQPLGSIGEICVGGVGVSDGYLNRPELTKEKYIPNPFKKGEFIYKTGDLGKWLPNGDLEFHGRKDDQVKIRGHRIELGEIEYRLLDKETITEAVAIVIADDSGNKQLVMYFTSTKKEILSELREELKEKLPVYMIPDSFVQLEEMPLNINGKIDKKQLSEIKGASLSAVEYVAPRDEMEARIVALWQEILKRDRIGVKDSFFEIGGNSLKAIQLIARIQKEYNVSFEMAGLYETPTVEALKEKLENVLWVTNQKVADEENIESFSF